MELDAGDYRRGGLSLTQANKLHHVHTIARVAAMLGEDEDWLRDVVIELDQEAIKRRRQQNPPPKPPPSSADPALLSRTPVDNTLI